MRKLPLIVVIIALVGGLQAAGGQSIVYNDPAGQGTQTFGGNLALDFTVNTPVTVDALGVFNASGNGVITGTIDVAIYDISTSTWVTPTAIFHGTYTPQGLGYDVFQPIASVTLAPGNYEVDAYGFSGADPNGNLNTGSPFGPFLNSVGGALTFTGAAWDFDNSSLDAPTNCSTCQNAPTPQDRQFDAGTFEVSEGGEPWLYLLLAGVVCFGAMAFAPRNSLESRA